MTFQHRAGVRPYTSSYELAESCVFAKQSQPPIHCGLLRHPGANPGHQKRHPFSRSYGAILPSSLARVLSIALVYSTYLPESVCSTSAKRTRYEAFLGSMGLTSSVRPKTFLRITSRRLIGKRICLLSPSTGLNRDIRHPDDLPYSVTPSLKRSPCGTGILTCFPSPTPFGLGLGID